LQKDNWQRLTAVGIEPLGSYSADGTVIWCFDRRCKHARDITLELLGWKLEDLVVLAGGAHNLALNPPTEATSQLLEQIEISVREHYAKEMLVMVHQGCAMYRDKIKVGTDEKAYLAGELRIARSRILECLKRTNFAGSVRMVLVANDGTYELQPEA
jgi:carbonic anhydrase